MKGRNRVKDRAAVSGGPGLRWTEAALAAAMILSFFLPWLSFLGSPVAAHRIRETLAGPHRFLSNFTRDSQVSLDYGLSLFLWAVPMAAGLVLALALLRRDRAWPGLLAGIAALLAFLFLRVELQSYPFQKLEEGAWLSLACGVGLLIASAVRGALALWKQVSG